MTPCIFTYRAPPLIVGPSLLLGFGEQESRRRTTKECFISNKQERSRLLESEVAGLQPDNEPHPLPSATSLPGSALAALKSNWWLLNHRSCSACRSNCWHGPQAFKKKPRPPGHLTSSFANCKALQEEKGAGELPAFSPLRLMREKKCWSKSSSNPRQQVNPEKEPGATRSHQLAGLHGSAQLPPSFLSSAPWFIYLVM